MAIIRSKRPDTHFTVIQNEVIRDERLSYKARGILIHILSNVDGWRITADDLAKKSKDGRTAVLSGLEELRSLGYIVTSRRQGADGKWTTESIVYDTPQTLPKSGFPTSVFPTSENPTPIEELSKKNYKDAEPNGSQVKDLMAIYFENFTGDLEMSRGQAAGQLQSALKQISYDQLAPAVKQVAIEGQVLSRNTLIQALRKAAPQNATPTPPRFVAEEQPKGEPMPTNFRQLYQNALNKRLEAQ